MQLFRFWILAVCTIFVANFAVNEDSFAQVPATETKPVTKTVTKPPTKPDFPPLEKITEGYTEIKVQDGTTVYWKQYGKKIALIQENLSIKGSDEESKSSVERLFTDKVLLSLPILTMVKGGGPVIDLDALLVGNARVFFGSSVSRPFL